MPSCGTKALVEPRSIPLSGRHVTEVIECVNVTLKAKCNDPTVRYGARDASATLGMTENHKNSVISSEAERSREISSEDAARNWGYSNG
jgi:hypothetical protein